MSKRIYVGNLSFSTTEDTLQDLFSAYGEVVSVSIIKDKVTEQSKGFGFVEMAEDEGVLKAISALAGKELDGRRIRVSEAEERRQNSGNRPSGNFGRNGGFRRNDRNGGYSRGDRNDRYSRNDRGTAGNPDIEY